MTQTPAPASTPAPLAATAPCPCGSGKIFGECCQPILQRKRPAANAEELMRSRYTAHAVRDFEHVHRTYAGTAGKPYTPETELADMKWTRLAVHSHYAGAQPDQAFVDFSAYFTDENGEHAIHELSEFKQIDGAWLYTKTVRNGPAPVKAAPKVGRNDPCPCGSGKKYKHCCGK
jgi:SEC-C motif domain protein